jgi:hypothetical protein
MYHSERWGTLQSRYEDPERPHRLLALDGGGIRGLITLSLLERLESLLAERSDNAKNFRLCQWFDYIAGTSTGAIIAAGLARGMSVQELIQFYRDSGQAMFESTHLMQRLISFYQADPLREKLRKVFGADTTLEPKHLQCLLLVVTQNITTDSPWPISSNPDAVFNDPSRKDCNLRIPLWQLVRASTAAPVYFPPEILRWDPDDESKAFVFVDGGVTPYNNPAFLLYRMATSARYRLGWKTGERKLLLVSVGTGAAATPTFKSKMNLASNALGLPGHLMYAIQVDQDINCRTVGRCTYGSMIDRELQDLTCRVAPDFSSRDEWLKSPHRSLDEDLGRDFLYARYNADLSREGLNAIGFSDIEPEDVQQMDSVKHIDELLRIGRAVGQQVSLSHFGSFV